MAEVPLLVEDGWTETGAAECQAPPAAATTS
jgi:hypothetical protein